MSMNSFHSRQKKPRPAAPAPAERPSGLLRADALLVAQGLAASRTAAQAMIKAGRVSWQGGAIAKPAFELPADTPLVVADDGSDRYVSRGGLKLAGALAETGIDVHGKVGVDVGHDQLHARLRSHPAVTAIEGVNCRALTAKDLGTAMPEGGFDLIVGDVSFISLTLILPQLVPLLAPTGQLLMLVKPQFEVGPANLGKGGIVRDPALYAEVERKFFDFGQKIGLPVAAWLDSPITGGDGNREFFIWCI